MATKAVWPPPGGGWGGDPNPRPRGPVTRCPRRPNYLTLRRNDRQQHGSLAARAEVQRDFAAENFRRPVDRIVVHERAATFHRVFHVRQRRRLALVFVVLAADRERDAVAFGNDDTSWPDLDVEFIDLPRRERLVFVVSVIR